MGFKIDYDRDQDLIKAFNQGMLDRRTAAEIQGLAAAIVYDNEVSDSEIGMLSEWVSRHIDQSDAWPLNELVDLLARILADRHVDDSERFELLTFLSAIAASAERSGTAADCIFDPRPVIAFPERSFAFTGRLERSPRKVAAAEVEARDGTFNRAVRLSTTYLVVGDLGTDNWITSRYGTKIEKVITARKQGRSDTQIVREVDFARALLVTPIA